MCLNDGGTEFDLTLNEVDAAQSPPLFPELHTEVIHILVAVLNPVQVCCGGGVSNPECGSHN